MSESGICSTVLIRCGARELALKEQWASVACDASWPGRIRRVDLAACGRLQKTSVDPYGFSAERSLIDVGRPWLKFLGWWRNQS